MGPGHPDTQASCANLAQAYAAVGRVSDALTLLRDALAHGERAERTGPAAGRGTTVTVRIPLGNAAAPILAG